MRAGNSRFPLVPITRSRRDCRLVDCVPSAPLGNSSEAAQTRARGILTPVLLRPAGTHLRDLSVHTAIRFLFASMIYQAYGSR